jgi:hypothetical protein
MDLQTKPQDASDVIAHIGVASVAGALALMDALNHYADGIGLLEPKERFGVKMTIVATLAGMVLAESGAKHRADRRTLSALFNEQMANVFREANRAA